MNFEDIKARAEEAKTWDGCALSRSLPIAAYNLLTSDIHILLKMVDSLAFKVAVPTSYTADEIIDLELEEAFEEFNTVDREAAVKRWRKK